MYIYCYSIIVGYFPEIYILITNYNCIYWL